MKLHLDPLRQGMHIMLRLHLSSLLFAVLASLPLAVHAAETPKTESVAQATIQVA